MILIILRFLSNKRFSLLKSKLLHLFLILVAMLISSSASPQVSADFTTLSANTGCGSLVVDFQGLSTGSPDTWLWDFGNGNSSTLQNPTAIYANPGMYDVTLVVSVSTSIFTDSKVSNGLINVFENPVAELATNSPVNGCMPLIVSFEDLSFTNNAIVSWQWDFGDGGGSSLQHPDYDYTNDGDFSVSLIVSDVNGCQSLSTDIDLIDVYEMATADFTADIPFSCNSNELVSFTNNTLGLATYIWDLGDGNISIQPNPIHNYATGLYSVTLFTKIGICTDTLVMTDLIEVIDSLSPNFTVNTNSGCEELDVMFSDITTNNPNTFLWQFGDGTTSILQNPIHSFDTVGIYDITLTTSISGQCARSVTFPAEIKVFAKPRISFVADTTLGCSIPFNVAFTDNTIDVANWSWDFGDGNFSNIQNPSNLYTTLGVFDVSLFVVNNDGCVSSDTFPNYIRIDESPIVNFNATPIVSCAGEDINFSDLSSIATNNWKWNFGDGGFSNTQNPIYQYALTGVYDVSLIAGINACKDTLVINNYIKIIEPTAVFEEIYDCDNPLKVQFENLSIGADNVFWDFGDGTSSTLLNPIHTFLNLGVHTVSLSTNNNLTGCTHVLSKQIKLTQPIANFDYLVNAKNGYKDSVGCTPKQVHINNTSQDFAFFSLHWGDGYIGHGPNHIYTTAGYFDVTLIVSDLHYCRDTMTIENMYHTHDVALDFGISNVLGCDSMLVEFEDLSNHPFTSVIWDFGDGGTSTINNPQYIYYNEGIYDVTLYAKSIYGCKDTLKRLEYINFQHPIANFNSNIQNVCQGDQVQFSNLSIGNSISSFWDFGDGTSSNILHPNHEFIANGLYNINLLIMDSFGCSDNLSLSNHIEVLSPTANFSTLSLSSNCPPLISNFTNLSSTDASLFLWNFGDGGTSLIEHPSHLFITSGSFDVSLVVTNQYGCKDTLVQNGLMDVLGPMGSFSVSDTLICKDDSVLFIPSVSNTDLFLWDLGNGVLSTDSFPSSIYTTEGIYLPSLIIKNTSGCQFTINNSDTITVRSVSIDAGINIEICEGDQVQLNATGNATQFAWSPTLALSNSNLSNPIANPTTDVMYYIHHSDGMCDAVDSIFVKVNNEIPSPTFVTINHCDGDTIQFSANSGLLTPNIAWEWSFGSSIQNPLQQLDLGTNSIQLIALNLDNNCSDTLVQQVEIYPLPETNFTALEVCLGESSNFLNTSSANVVSWEYSMADGIGVASLQNPSYIYSNAGIFHPSLVVTSDFGCTNDFITTVEVNELPFANFLVENSCVGVGELNTFTDFSTITNGLISSWEYIFGDGTANGVLSTEQHQYASAGTYNVILNIISDKGCESSVMKEAKVYDVPAVDFSSEQYCLGIPTSFSNFSTLNSGDIVQWEWMFGDGEGTANLEHPTYVFSNPGTYAVNLLVTTDLGCTSSLDKNIVIVDLPIANFIADPTACLGDNIHFTDLSISKDTDIASWEWSLGDGTTITIQNPSYQYEYAQNFDVTLSVVSDEGCKHDTTIIAVVEIFPNPIADFSASTFSTSEFLSEIEFYNNSSGETSCFWDFDNAVVSAEENPIIDFEQVKDYEVLLNVVSAEGCESEITKTVHILPEYTLYAPNAFSPNGDGNNDVFLAQGNGVGSFEMQVFDRWGGLVFESSDIEYGWDGLDASANTVAEGTYMYHIALYDFNEKLWIYNGELNLMR